MNKKEKERHNKISKTMSYILRHGLIELELDFDNKGRITIDTLLNNQQMKDLNANEDIVKLIIESSDKKRFNIEEVDGKIMIGANQGHNKDVGELIDNDILLEELKEPVDKCVHGTYNKFIDQIMKEGLKTMTRKHIHFSIGYSDDNKVISGMRKSCDIFIEIDMKKAIDDGIKFYKSYNNVILTSGINNKLDSKYFLKINYK